MISKTTDPLLQKTEEAIAAKGSSEPEKCFQRIITAGLRSCTTQDQRHDGDD